MKVCPISYIKVDQTSIRIHAGFIYFIGMFFVFNVHFFWLLILLYDFTVRVFGYGQMSFLYHLSKFIVKALGLNHIETDIGPKQFAAKIGLGFVITAVIAYAGGFNTFTVYIVSVLMVCAFFEAFFAYCIGCEFYSLLYKTKKKGIKYE